MTDLELTKACAEAMGLHVCDPQCFPAMLLVDAGAGPFNYDPLHDNAQAFQLLKRFPVTCIDALDNLIQWGPHKDADRQGLDMNRCICECVAKMKGKATGE